MVTEPASPSLVDTALSQVGVIELTDHNDGEQVEAFLASVGLHAGPPWCSAYVHWVYRRCGQVEEPARQFAMAMRWAKGDTVWHKRVWEPQPGKWKRITHDGDLFLLYYKELGRIGHVGFVIGEDEDYIHTVEGNTNAAGSREGGGVYRRKRLKKGIHLIVRWPLVVPLLQPLPT